MSTPFQKAFPNADENTVFEVIRTSQRFTEGDLVKITKDDGSDSPIFCHITGGASHYIWLNSIRIKEPQLKKGDRCLVSMDGKDWQHRTYYCDASDVFPESPHACHAEDGSVFVCWRFVKPLPQTQTVTLQDGTELTIPNDEVEKLREEYA